MNVIKVTSSRACPLHQKNHAILVDEAGYKNWQDGWLIQEALPDVTTDPEYRMDREHREILISGFCPKAWDHFCGEEDPELRPLDDTQRG